MPIRPENRKRYPWNWPVIRGEVLHRANGKCEWCGVQDHVYLRIKPNGTRWEISEGELDAAALDGDKIAKVVLTIAHLDHQPENNGTPGNRPNLRALCQRCHNRYDAPHRVGTAAETRRRKMEAAGQLSIEVKTWNQEN